MCARGARTAGCRWLLPGARVELAEKRYEARMLPQPAEHVGRADAADLVLVQCGQLFWDFLRGIPVLRSSVTPGLELIAQGYGAGEYVIPQSVRVMD